MLMKPPMTSVAIIVVPLGWISSIKTVFIVDLKRIVVIATVPAGISILPIAAASTAPESPSSATVVLGLRLCRPHKLVTIQTSITGPLCRHWFEAHGPIDKDAIVLRRFSK